MTATSEEVELTAGEQREIAAEAIAIATQSGLDRARVETVLTKTAGDDHGTIRYVPSLKVALQYLGARRALNLFETTDQSELFGRVLFAAYLLSPDTPLMSLTDLAGALGNFLPHLHENRESLLKTGLPHRVFHESPWLDRKLSNLYPCKLPFKVKITPDDKGHLLTYDWPDSSVETWPHSVSQDHQNTVYERLTVRGTEPNVVPHESAAAMSGLLFSTAKQLEGLRQFMFDLKVASVGLMYEAVRQENAQKLLDNLCQRIQERVTFQDFKLMWEVEEVYRVGRETFWEALCHPHVPHLWCVRDLRSGGLLDVLESTLHCEMECSQRTHAELHRLIGKSLTLLGNRSIPPSACYFALLAKGQEKAFIDTLDLWTNHTGQLQTHRAEFFERLRPLAEPLDWRPPPGIRMPKELVPVYLRHHAAESLRSFAELVQPATELKPPALQGVQPSHDFRTLTWTGGPNFAKLGYSAPVEFKFTDAQARAMRALFEGAAHGNGWVHSSAICAAAYPEDKDAKEQDVKRVRRMHDLFKTSRAWQTLIESGHGKGRKGFYRLNP